MSRTRSDLVARVLSRLGVADDGDDLAPEDVAKVDPELPGIVAELSRQEIVAIPDLDDIPDEVFGHLSAIVANAVADDFGIPTEEAAKIAQRRDEAEVRLRRMRNDPKVFRPMRPSFW